jgi:hypothetical protein
LIKLPSNDDSAGDAGFAGVGDPAPDRHDVERRRRAVGRIRTGTSRITTSDAAVTPRPPRADAGFAGVG